DRLSATPTSLLNDRADFARIMGSRDADQHFEPVPHVKGVDWPWQRLPPPERRSPATLLRFESEVVPFRKRKQELEALEHWCTRESAPVRLLVGSAGTGKTRLAAEFTRRLDAQGWMTGFVTENAADDVLERSSELDSPSLVVVDSAETRDRR